MSDALGGAFGRHVDHVQQQVGGFELFERGAKRRDQVGRQLGDEADGVGQQRFLAARQHDPPRERIERGKQLVLGQRASLSQPIEQRALARVGVADQRDDRHAGPLARRALAGAVDADAFDLFLERADAGADQASVDLDLGLARSTAHADTADLTFEVGPGARQTRQQVFQPRQVDLHAAFVGARALGEDVQDQQRAIDDAHDPGSPP